MTVAVPYVDPLHHAWALSQGAQCHRCSLFKCGAGPVPPTLPAQIDVLVVAEAPGATEVQTGATLVGASGREIRTALKNANADPAKTGYTNAMLCLDGWAQVRLADGSTMRIAKMIKDQHPGPVRTVLDSTGTLGEARVVGWFTNPRSGREIRKVNFQAARSSVHGVSSIRATGDHLFLTPHGFVAARDLDGEYVATGQRALAGTSLKIALGTLLGDAQLVRSRITFSHAVDQEQYALLKAQALSGLITTKRYQKTDAQDQIVVSTRATRWLSFLEQSRFGKKKGLGKEARDLLTNEFDDLSLAVWFCDDGYTRIRPGRQPDVELATCGYTRADVDFLAGLLYKNGISSHIRYNSGWRIVFNTENSAVLHRRIARYVPPELYYKLPDRWHGLFDAAAYKPVSPVTFWDRAVVSAVSPRADTVYCLEIEGTHNFVTTGGVVSNCRPPEELKRYLVQIKKQQKTDPDLMTPIQACQPRLKKELARAKFAILMGGASLLAAGVSGSIMKLRGTTVQIPDGPTALPILHAAFVMRDEGKLYRPLLHADVKKAVRIAYNGSTWRDPPYFVPRSAAEVENFLAVPRERVALDVETDGKDPWTCGLRRVGIGTNREVMIYAPLSVRGHMLLPDHEVQAQSRAVAAYLQRASYVVTQNGIAFDSIIMHRYRMPLLDERTFDTMVGHAVGPTSELPHSLAFLGSMYTDAPYWKDDFKHSTVKDDEILNKYLANDIAVTHEAAPFVVQNLVWSQQTEIYNLDAELSRIGRSMSALGVWIDPERRWKLAQEYQAKSDKLRAEFVQIARAVMPSFTDDDPVNPGSYPQVRKLLYQGLGLPVLENHVTDTGEPSTDEPALLDLLGLGLDARAQKVVQGLLGYREAEKILGTNLGHIVNGQLVGGPRVHADGCVRASWRPGKRSGRWGSNDPNMQNIPSKLRAMFRPMRGNKFVAADAQAQELRMIAMLADDRDLIEAFKAFDEGKGPDVHTFNACTVFRCTPDKVTKPVRDMIKRFVYALSYDAQPPTIYRTLSLLRNDDLSPMFPGITLAEVERLYNLWWRLHPAIPDWKKKLIYAWRADRFIATRIGGRKRYFVGGESPTEMPNHDVQGSSASMQNDAIRGMATLYPFDYERHRGVLINGHDQIVVECADHEVEDVKRKLGSVMQKKIQDTFFPALAKAGDDWKDAS